MLYLAVYVLTRPWEEPGSLPLSCEDDEKLYGELISDVWLPEYRSPKLLQLKSGLFESHGVIPESELSQKEGNPRSVLGLPLLKNDMSLSATDGSYLAGEPLPRVNGDLFQ
uniref:Uncharacterized protein n=1 Tax=Rhizophora mucronata TaxID=61149 RepID=A0A2P2LW62_RHIMU